MEHYIFGIFKTEHLKILGYKNLDIQNGTPKNFDVQNGTPKNLDIENGTPTDLGYRLS